MSLSVARRVARSVEQFPRFVAIAALALGIGLLMPAVASAQSHGGGGGHSSAVGGFHGQSGGGYHGGGYHGGGYYGGGWHGGGWRGGWGWGGFGWGCCGWYDGFYPGFGFGYDAYDPFWAYGYDDPALAYGPPPGAYGAPPQQQAYAYPPSPPQQGSGFPNDNSRGFYLWPLGIQTGQCDRAYVQQAAVSLTGQPAGRFPGGTMLGGISVAPVIRGRVLPRLDLTDQVCATEALEHARTGDTVSWQTAEGVPVTMKLTRNYQEAGRPCREFETSLTFASGGEISRGSACKASNGSWEARR